MQQEHKEEIERILSENEQKAQEKQQQHEAQLMEAKDKLDAMEQEKKKEQALRLCGICETRMRDCMLDKCPHLYMCIQCAE